MTTNDVDQKIEKFKTEIMSKIKPTSDVRIWTMTEVKLKGGKKNPHVGNIFKLVEEMGIAVYGMARFASYQDFVRAQLTAEGKDPESFTAGKLPWGVPIEGTPLLEHKGELYLRAIALDSGTNRKYFLKDEDGKLSAIAKEDIQGMDAPVARKPEEERKVQQGGAEEQIQVRSIKLANITGFWIDGKMV